MICRHCSKSRINRPRGLCWNCYYAPGVREQYPSTSKYARRGFGNIAGGLPLPAAPTTAAPGTPEKLAVLEQRARSNQAIFHPADARWPGDERPEEWLRGRPPAAPSGRLFVVPVTMTSVGVLVAGQAVEPAFARHEFVVGESPAAPGLPDLDELKRRVAEWKRESALTGS